MGTDEAQQYACLLAGQTVAVCVIALSTQPCLVSCRIGPWHGSLTEGPHHTTTKRAPHVDTQWVPLTPVITDWYRIHIGPADL